METQIVAKLLRLLWYELSPHIDTNSSEHRFGASQTWTFQEFYLCFHQEVERAFKEEETLSWICGIAYGCSDLGSDIKI